MNRSESLEPLRMTLAAQCCPNMTVRQEAEEIIVTYSIGGVPYDAAWTISQEPARFSNTWAAIPMEAESAPLAGHGCEYCLGAPALILQPAPWGGDGRVCGVCDNTRDLCQP